VSTLYRGLRRLDAGSAPGAGAVAVLVVDEQIAWTGPDDDALTGVGTTVDLEGALLLPGFTDAHVHVAETGLLLDGVDLATAGSVGEILDRVAAAASARPGRPVLGHGWDELRLAEGRAPTGAELDRAGGGAEVYLSRVDVHSAVVSGALAERAGLRGRLGWDPSGRLERDAHHAARHATRFDLDRGRRRDLHRLALEHAAAAGLTELHEMSAPHIAPGEDLADLMELVDLARLATRSSPVLPDVVPYRGELAADEGEVAAIRARLGALGLPRIAGLAGDLMVDGSFGSRTAALRADYADAPGHRGHLYLDAGQVRDHVVACTRAGLQAGFHVIGDAGVDAVLEGFAAAADVVGRAAIRAAGHRLEHLESPDRVGVGAVALLGLTASVQPAFDAAWGGTDRMYAVRLGAERAARLNPFASLASAGVRMVFGSDSPVTPFAPWEAVRAALTHRTPAERIGLGPALAAHTGDRTLTAGAPATFTAWAPATASRSVAELAAQLLAGDAAPQCCLTVVRGRVAHRAGQHG
jgi:predicted amidohydrolase YtcJ